MLARLHAVLAAQGGSGAHIGAAGADFQRFNHQVLLCRTAHANDEVQIQGVRNMYNIVHWHQDQVAVLLAVCPAMQHILRHTNMTYRCDSHSVMHFLAMPS